MECAQINIKGGKATKTPSTHSIPGIYKVCFPPDGPTPEPTGLRITPSS